MPTFEFQVKEVSVGPHEHSWQAENIGASGRLDHIDLPKGGDNDLVGQYPEIEVYLKDKFKITVQLAYHSMIDRLKINEDGTAIWTFRRQDAVVIVNDIVRRSLIVSTTTI